jgi:hypothetical protein
MLGGCEVAIAFLGGQLSKPVIVGVRGQFGDNTAPIKLELGGPGGAPVARVGDTVNVFIGSAPVVLNGTVSGAPFVGTGVFTQSVTGVIQAGSSKVFST